jgi:hypothetical protein
MPFFLTNNHIHFNISGLAKSIIEQDCYLFSHSTSNPIVFSSFLNTLFTILIEKVLDKEFKVDYSLLHHKEKGGYLKIRLRDEIVRYSRNSQILTDEALICKNKFGTFLKVITETYARLPFLKRESIYLYNVIDTIQRAIKGKKKLSIHYLNREEPVLLTPYKIFPTKENIFHYLVGFNEGKVQRYRLSKIIDISTCGKADKIDSTLKNKYDWILDIYGPTFINQEIETIVIRMDDVAKYEYLNAIIYRPFHSKIEDNDTFTFEISEKQAIYFFFKSVYLAHIEIISPISFKNRLTNMVNDLLEQHNNLKSTL